MTSMGQLKSNAIRGARSRYGHTVIINNPASPYHGRVGIIKSYNIDNDLFKVSFNEDTGEEHNFHEDSLVNVNIGYSGKRKSKSKRKPSRKPSKKYSRKPSKKYSRKH